VRRQPSLRGALIRIASVSDPASGSLVSPVTFSQFRLGTSDYSPKFFLTPPGLINAAVIDEQVICNVVCAFGNLEGTFSFTVQSPGYSAKQVTVDAKYSTVTGKCEKRASGPTEVRITLEKL
jgi:hypothetical protein